MKAISLWEPWATAIALGLKLIETRGWYTSYRGPIAIHAAKTHDHANFIFDPSVKALFEREGIMRVEDLSFGCIVAVGKIVACTPTEQLCPGLIERAFGNYDNGRFGWALADVRRLEKPVPARGSQGFWEWDGGSGERIPQTGELPGFSTH